MDEGDARRPLPDGAADLQALAWDWITLWQSELTAAAADREVQEHWQSLAALWAGAAAAMVHAWPRGGRDEHARPAQPPRPAAAAAAPDARDAEIERLHRRLDDLERQLRELAGGGGDPGGTGG